MSIPTENRAGAEAGWAVMKHAYIRVLLAILAFPGVWVALTLCWRLVFGESGGPGAGWFHQTSLFAAVGAISALPLWFSPTRNWRETATVAAMGLVGGIQALAGVAAAILLLSDRYPEAPDDITARLLVAVTGILMAAPVIFGTIVVVHRRRRDDTGQLAG